VSSKEVIPIGVQAIVPTNTGTAVFLGNEEKIFVIYMDPSVGSAISMFINGTTKERPLTHDLMALMLQAFGARVERVIINDLQGGTYFARLILVAENELMQRKVIELDARPSDCLALAAQQGAPVYVSREVWEEVEDMTDVLQKLGENKEGEDEEEDPAED
jgi:bifunctional DNase/RNase